MRWLEERCLHFTHLSSSIPSHVQKLVGPRTGTAFRSGDVDGRVDLAVAERANRRVAVITPAVRRHVGVPPPFLSRRLLCTQRAHHGDSRDRERTHQHDLSHTTPRVCRNFA